MIEWFDARKTGSPFNADLYPVEFGLPETRTAEEIMSIDKIIKGFNYPVNILDIACGYGRISQKLAGLYGIKSVYGIDLNQQFVKKTVTRGINGVSADMRGLPFRDNRFDLAILMFSSFGYFADKSDDQLVLSEAYRILDYQGIFILDMPNFDRIIINFQPNRRLSLPNGQIMNYTKTIDDDMLVETRTLIQPDGDRIPLLPIRMRIYPSNVIYNLCKQAGFASVTMFNHLLQPFDSESSKRLWLVCNK